MGYTTEFYGKVEIVPPLNELEIEFLNKFSSTRRMLRENGPYYVDGSGYAGQGRDADVFDYNNPPKCQPGLWCQWVPTANGKFIEWDGNEKFYNSVEWMEYLIEHFLKPNCIAQKDLPFLQANHIVNGKIRAQGEDRDDSWCLIVEDNAVFAVDFGD